MSWRPVPSESDKTGRIADRTNLSELTVHQCFMEPMVLAILARVDNLSSS
jgi:hypothetical protein